MENFERILSDEVANTSRIVFYRDGERYTAFQHSAWFVAAWLIPGHPFLTRNMGYSSVVYMLFSKEVLEPVLDSYDNILCASEKIIVPVPVPFDVHAYYNWRNPRLADVV